MQHRLLCAALGLAALFAPVAAGSAQLDGWEAEPFDAGTGCYVARFVEKNLMVGFHYMTEKREFRIALSSENWDALVADGDRQGKVELRLTTPGGLRTLSTKEGYAMPLGGGTEAVAAIWYAGEGETVRSALSTASAMTVTFDGDPVGTFPLQGASGAIDALMACVADLGKS
ncbi:hypothetical protein [Novosphingobium sp.]|uniref:hypothetical protein n=1 Tax=Novosphingobium sp. TaxID=1874826 RepID=UPI00286C8BD8|nr:hypothetical protein [Novosphingobium sp.]